KNRITLKPIEGQALRDTIERPALACGVSFEEGLVEAMVEDFNVQPSGALPFLQEALLRIWQAREKRVTSGSIGDQSWALTLKAYLDMGRLRGALNSHAESVWEMLEQRGRD